VLGQVDSRGESIRYRGSIPYAEIQSAYRSADLAIFASSCETFGQIVTEYMAAGLPIACSSRSAMPELLGDTGLYFDPEDPKDIARVLTEYVISPKLRAEKAEMSYRRAHRFSWERCAADTFRFLSKTAAQHRDEVMAG
jgi:glycosyltransferase involved in cell wall biosynthesis